jgi:hypothetical protein
MAQMVMSTLRRSPEQAHRERIAAAVANVSWNQWATAVLAAASAVASPPAEPLPQEADPYGHDTSHPQSA